ncbi:SAM-dependent methyltransferase [Antarctobacter heliothermus]|uniref:Cyclopropane-fatty-acyl-phospholipid synthase n=1 Tax=Antarctobacter heliothermus TaxID=74033 RepID=A0A239KKW8_9RHOB|nr:cyclopropane-fatty-acyl-phospholipid synthase family protein [Antarctobacter heliothermus]SNT18715.1 cyclopropane-fatty-acyl-phospholipid synthase [Antarctobacter heliothermus]
MSESLFCNMLRRMVRHGHLTVTLPSGRTEVVGSGQGDSLQLTLTGDGTIRRLLQRPGLALGECYTDGTLQIEGDDLPGLLNLLAVNQSFAEMPLWYRVPRSIQGALRGFLQRNTPFSARRNVAHHYDLSDDLYRLFLDADMQYSCAYFTRPDMTLEEAQAAKKAHIARKLLIEPGMKVLDIGCGWGGMALTLARDYGANVTGVTLSENQLATAQARAKAEGLEDRVTFRLLDYRRLEERFDRIVSVGMLEHVGVPHYGEYFGKVRDLMADDGVAVIHSIVKNGPPRPNNAWIDKYIFPGSYAPSASEIYRAIENSWFHQSDDEALRIHYALTLKGWRERLEAQRDTVEAMFDAKFMRMWRFYLASMEVAFQSGNLHVQQWQLAKSMSTVPITRDYLYPATQAAYDRAAE